MNFFFRYLRKLCTNNTHRSETPTTTWSVWSTEKNSPVLSTGSRQRLVKRSSYIYGCNGEWCSFEPKSRNGFTNSTFPSRWVEHNPPDLFPLSQVKNQCVTRRKLGGEGRKDRLSPTSLPRPTHNPSPSFAKGIPAPGPIPAGVNKVLILSFVWLFFVNNGGFITTETSRLTSPLHNVDNRKLDWR